MKVEHTPPTHTHTEEAITEQNVIVYCSLFYITQIIHNTFQAQQCHI